MTILCQAVGRSPELDASIGGGVRAADSLAEVERMLTADPGETLVVIGPDIDTEAALGFAAGQRLRRPALGVVLVREQVDVELLTRALRSGVREVVTAGELAELAQACERSRALSRSSSAPSAEEQASRGQVVTVFSAKGGCGKTTLAVNLALALADGGARSVCLVDLDLAFGDVAINLQLDPNRTLTNGLPMVGRLDETGATSLLTPYRDGLSVLLAPVTPGEAEKIPAALVSELLDALRESVDYVVVDTPSQFSEHVLNAMDASQHHVLLTTPDVPALKNLRLTLDMLDLLSYPREMRSVVLNRSDAKVGLSTEDVERVVRCPIAAYIPSSRDVPISINKGTPIRTSTPQHPVSQAITRFVQEALLKPASATAAGAGETSREPRIPPPRKQGAFARLRKGRR
ncbi:AAA family ATPase [Haloechinothrix halophila]|uniref:AAA family ATPase n=1 Tax=Haloechinothrix halophila TaxID=1069073 RepID=UPI00041C9F2B|nr:P-loop NTPase [Haloechinothrix halophila]